MKVICITKRWQHHTASGGYDRLADSLGAEVVTRARKGTFTGRIQRRLGRWDVGTRKLLFDYRPEDRQAEYHALVRSWLKKADIVHVLYGDEQLDFLLKARALVRGKLIATFHVPFWEVAKRFDEQAKLLCQLDGAIVMSRVQVQPIQNVLGDRPVRFIPHGIDTNVFCPGAESRGERLKLLTVGGHFRDFEMIRTISNRCATVGLPVDFEVISHAGDGDHVRGCPNITFRSSVSEADLIRAYRRAHALFMPILDATATNAALEAMACGLPVITNDVGGMRDYIDDRSGWLLPSKDFGTMFHLVRSLCNNKNAAEELRRGARVHAETMSWSEVADQVKTFYSDLLRSTSPLSS